MAFRLRTHPVDEVVFRLAKVHGSYAYISISSLRCPLVHNLPNTTTLNDIALLSGLAETYVD